LKVNLIAPTAQNASGSMVIGSFTNGLKAIGLSHLEIDSTSLGSTFDNWLSLGSVGNTKNPLSITISGDHQLFLLSSDDAKSYIQHLTVDNSAGVDLSGLTRGVQSFDPGGATIIGGVADDVLVGGDGNDLIRSGAGANNVISSTGADRIWLKANSGLDILTFTNIDTSVAQDGIDAVHNFGAFDTIDISALVNSVLFEGNFDSFAEGEAALSTSVSSAFFNKASNTLYVDVDHDGTILSLHDLGVRLIGVSSIQSFNLLD
jgi:Ca2+-binding RTX toxin-like protein